MNKFYNLTFLLLFLCTLTGLRGANELYINGPGSATSTATLYDSTCLIFVNGEIKNSDGLFINRGGTIELTGNWTNTVSSNKYQSTGTEKFYGTSEQVISGTLNGTTYNSNAYDNQFCNLKVYRKSTITTTPAKYISLGANVNVAGSISFETSTPNTTWAGTGTNEAVIRTNLSSPSNVASYAYELYLRNPLNTSLNGYTTISSNGQDRYIEGKLRRQVNAAASYDFPVGFAPTVKDGMEGFNISFNAAPTDKSILGHIEDQTQSVLYRNILCDVGKDPGPGNNPFPDCNGTPDGIYDLYYLDASNDLSHEWIATASDALGTINYNFTAYPGSSLDDLSKYKDIPTACGNPYQTKLLRVLAKDGIVGGSSQIGPGNWFPFRHLTTYIWCQFPSAGVQAISLNNQTSFSKFRIHGTNLFSSTALPVQLTDFRLTPIDNTYFQLDWTTASEVNNYGFELERSTDAQSFYSIAFVRGNGTTALPHSYTQDDWAVVAETDYYYRLKIIDLDGTHKYSNTIKGRLKGNMQLAASDFYPSPTSGTATLNLYAPANGNLQTMVYDVLGQVVKSKNDAVTQGNNKIEYDFSDLAKATYLVNITLDNQKITKKLIKQ